VTSVTTTTEARGERGLARWAALGGVAYVVLFIIGALLLFDGPTGDEAPARYLSYYGQGGHRDRAGVGWVIAMLGVLCLIWFLARLRDVVASYGMPFFSSVVFLGGALYATMTAVSISLRMGTATMSDDTFGHVVYPGVIHGASDAAYVIHAAGAVGATSFIVAASLAALRAGRISSWVGWVGIVLGLIGLFSIIFFPMVAIAIWLVAASIILLRQPAAREVVTT
jgi:hypothetical protein